MIFVSAACLGWILGCNVGVLMRIKVALVWNALTGCMGALAGCVVFDWFWASGHPRGAPLGMALGAACAGSMVVLAIYNAILCRPGR